MTLFPRPFSVSRVARSLVRGVWTLGTPATFTATGSIQPLTGRDLMVLEPATRNIGKVWIYTSDTLHIRKDGSSETSDTVTWNGYKWEVIDEKPYISGIIPHHKYMAELRGPA